MSQDIQQQTQRTCFVVMGFGKKTDFETGRVLDMDASSHNLIKPAVEDAGLTCIRADEIAHSGIIDVPMYEQLLNADVVVADLSTSNNNAYYELGVRHALRPHTTLIIAEDGIKKFPFDVNRNLVRQYKHLGDDIGVGEARRFSRLLTDAIVQIIGKDPRDKDSPVYTYLHGLTPPALRAAAEAVAEALGGNGSAPDGNGGNEATAPLPHSLMMRQVDEAQQRGDWVTAKNGLSFIRGTMVQSPDTPEDPYIVQRHALATYKSRQPSEAEALREARAILETLKPETSNDTETLGLWGAVHKRLWEVARERDHLDTAVRAYERGFYLRNDYYNGINLAFLLNVRAANATDRADAIADFVHARRVRKEVLPICEAWLRENGVEAQRSLDDEIPDAEQDLPKALYWVLATMGEAHVGLGEEAKAEERLAEAYRIAPLGWMQQSTEEQIAKLRPLLADSPLKYVRTDDAA
jgi:hypothetical protein